jgi:hypothetical protein
MPLLLKVGTVIVLALGALLLPPLAVMHRREGESETFELLLSHNPLVKIRYFDLRRYTSRGKAYVLVGLMCSTALFVLVVLILRGKL